MHEFSVTFVTSEAGSGVRYWGWGAEGLKMIEEELLEYYLGLDEKRRARQFADTAWVANFVGLSQRTIQLWIEIGLIRAVRIGRKYQVDLESVKAHLRACASGESDGN